MFAGPLRGYRRADGAPARGVLGTEQRARGGSSRLADESGGGIASVATRPPRGNRLLLAAYARGCAGNRPQGRGLSLRRGRLRGALRIENREWSARRRGESRL